MTEIASAYVALTVKAPHIKKDIESEIDKVDTDKAGGKLGEGLGQGITNKQAAIAGAVGGIFASLANTAANAIGNLFADAVQQSDATDKFAKSLDFANLDAGQIGAAVADAQKYADQTVYSLGDIQSVMAGLASNGIKGYTELSAAAGNLNAVAGGNESTFKSVAMVMTQTAGQGKLTTENFNQLADAIPAASGQLQEALLKAGAYTGNFRDAMAKGEITADEFNDAILALGSQPIAVEAATSVDTMEGSVGNLSAAITGQLANAFTFVKPLIAGATSFLAGLISNSDTLIPILGGVAGVIVAAVVPAIWAMTTALLANPVTWIALAIGALIAALVALWMNWDDVVKWISDVWGGFLGWLTDGIEAFASWWDNIWGDNGIGGFFKSAWEGYVEIVKGVWNAIVGWIEGGINSVIDLINGILTGVNIVGSAFGVSIDLIPKVDLPGLAEGGTITRPGSVIVGENGPEILRLPKGASVDPNISGSGGNVQMHVYPTPGMSEQTIGDIAARKIAATMRSA